MNVGGLFLYAVIIFICARGSIKKRSNGSGSSKGIKPNNRKTRNQMSLQEIEAAKAKIRERLQKIPDPHTIPKEAKQPSPETIELYHDAMDECDTKDCDVTANANGKVVLEKCDMPGCDVDKNKVTLAQTQPFRRLPLVYQLTVADAVLRRGGKALNKK